MLYLHHLNGYLIRITCVVMEIIKLVNYLSLKQIQGCVTYYHVVINGATSSPTVCSRLSAICGDSARFCFNDPCRSIPFPQYIHARNNVVRISYTERGCCLLAIALKIPVTVMIIKDGGPYNRLSELFQWRTAADFYTFG